MKFNCYSFKYNEGCVFLGMHIGASLKKEDRHLRLQLDLFKYGIVFIIRFGKKESE